MSASAAELIDAEFQAAIDAGKVPVNFIITRRHADEDARPDAHEHYMRSTVEAWKAIARIENGVIFLFIAGYENDVRELWEVPAVRRFVKRWEKETGALSDPRLSPSAREFLALLVGKTMH